MNLRIKFTKKQLHIFLLLFLSMWELILPPIQVPVLGEMSLLKIYALFSIVLVLPKYPIKNKNMRQIFIALVLLYFYGIISISWASSHYNAISRIVNYLISFIVIWDAIALIKNIDDFRFAIKLIYVFLVMIMLFSLLEIVIGKYFFYTENEYLGNSYGLLIPIVNQRGPNEFAAEIITMLPFGLIYVNDEYKVLLEKLLWIVVGFIVLMIDSRSGIVGFAILLLLKFWCSERNRIPKMIFTIIVCGFVILIMLLGITEVDSSFFSDSSRLQIWSSYISKLIDSKLIGIGWGVVGTGNLNGIYSMTEGSVHNYFLEIAVELGAVGLICIMFVFMKIIRGAYRLYTKNKRNYTALNIFMFGIAYLVATIGPSSIRAINNIWILWGIALAYLYNVSHKEELSNMMLRDEV